MVHLNVEIKARCSDLEHVREILRDHEAKFMGVDHQVDTYFKVLNGRLKLREGNIETALVFYIRENQSGPKNSFVNLMEIKELYTQGYLKAILMGSLGVLVVVDKHREIYFIDNVKFHVDEVKRLGSFVEIEAIDRDGNIGEKQMRAQCRQYLKLLGIKQKDLCPDSYSDMLIGSDT